jgi:YD repeat-containing protein
MTNPSRVKLAAALLLAAATVRSAETISYTYDAKGRVVRVVRTGSVNNNVTTQYAHDKADNRKTKTTTNSANPPPP